MNWEEERASGIGHLVYPNQLHLLQGRYGPSRGGPLISAPLSVLTPHSLQEHKVITTT